MGIKLFRDGKVVYRTTRYVRQRIYSFVEAKKNSEWDYGTCRVWYNVENDYWNEFEFHTVSQLNKILVTDTEPDLVATFA